MKLDALIKLLFDRSGKTVVEFASQSGVSLTHLSGVINGKQPGTIAMLEKVVVKGSGLPIESVLQVPPLEGMESEAEMINVFRAISPTQRRLVIDLGTEFLGALRDGRKRQTQKPAPAESRKSRAASQGSRK